jgi:hypothetical protein
MSKSDEKSFELRDEVSTPKGSKVTVVTTIAHHDRVGNYGRSVLDGTASDIGRCYGTKDVVELHTASCGAVKKHGRDCFAYKNKKGEWLSYDKNSMRIRECDGTMGS